MSRPGSVEQKRSFLSEDLHRHSSRMIAVARALSYSPLLSLLSGRELRCVSVKISITA